MQKTLRFCHRALLILTLGLGACSDDGSSSGGTNVDQESNSGETSSGLWQLRCAHTHDGLDLHRPNGNATYGCFISESGANAKADVNLGDVALEIRFKNGNSAQISTTKAKPGLGWHFFFELTSTQEERFSGLITTVSINGQVETLATASMSDAES